MIFAAIPFLVEAITSKIIIDMTKSTKHVQDAVARASTRGSKTLVCFGLIGLSLSLAFQSLQLVGTPLKLVDPALYSVMDGYLVAASLFL